MKEKIHPKYFNTTAACACGAVYDIASTRENVRVDICSNCHPLFTGKQKLLDTEGRVVKFQKKYAGVEVKKAPRRITKTRSKKAAAKKKITKPSAAKTKE